MNGADYPRQTHIDSLFLEEKLNINLLRQPQEDAATQTAVLPEDVRQLLVIKEEAPWSPSLDPGLLQIKQEPEELWDSEEEEEEDDEAKSISDFSFTEVIVKSEDEEEEPESSQLYQSHTEPSFSDSADGVKTEQDEDHCEDAAGSSDCDRLFNKSTYGNNSDSAEIEVSDDWQRPFSGTQAPVEDAVQRFEGSKSTIKSFFCPECGTKFHHRQSLQRHIKRNLHKGSSGCLLSKKFLRLKQNTDSQTGGEKLFDCDVCGKRLKYQHNLKTHMKVHTGEKSFTCDVCGQKFTHQQNLKTHMRIHTGEKPFVCDICGKRARHQNNLKIHMRVHTGEKPFSCDHCGKRFKRKAHLTTHMTVHTGDKPFACDVCGKRFNRKSHLRTHMMVHSGDKPFICDVCGKRFNRKTHLDTHITVHTGERPFSCAICGQGFTQQGSLNRHMRFHTG